MSELDKPRTTQVKMPPSLTISPALVTETIRESLRVSWGHLRHAPKLLARAIDSNERTASNMLEGRNAPSAHTLVKLMAEDDEVFAAVLRLANRQPPATLSETQRRAITEALKIMEGSDA